MQVAILKEKYGNRVAGTPQLVKFLKEHNYSVVIEEDAGIKSSISNEEYSKEGANIVTRNEALNSDIILSINPWFSKEIDKIKDSATIFSMFQPFNENSVYSNFVDQNLKLISYDMFPRITLAQSMDILSSMASISGYKAVIEASNLLGRYVPMLTTAAGTIPPAKVLVIGAGVAGLQAIATAKRLGAVVEAFDTRSASKEEVQSLGAKFVEVEGATDDTTAGGYAVEQTEEYKRKQKEALTVSIKKSDIVITTAQLRGRPAPKIITKEMLESMKPGSVIIDLAASTGGNCELTQNDKTINAENITIVGNSELSDLVPEHASVLFSKNIMNMMKYIIKDGEFILNKDDQIINSALIVDGNEDRYKSVK